MDYKLVLKSIYDIVVFNIVFVVANLYCIYEIRDSLSDWKIEKHLSQIMKKTRN